MAFRCEVYLMGDREPKLHGRPEPAQTYFKSNSQNILKEVNALLEPNFTWCGAMISMVGEELRYKAADEKLQRPEAEAVGEPYWKGMDILLLDIQRTSYCASFHDKFRCFLAQQSLVLEFENGERMVRFESIEAVYATFKPLSGLYDVIYRNHRPDIDEFVGFAAPRKGENVLDLGTGSAWVAVAMKRIIETGVCGGVNITKELLQIDARHNIESAGFVLPDNGQLNMLSMEEKARRVIHLFCGDITKQEVFMAAKTWLPDGVTGFDVITAFWTLETLPLDQQEKALKLWKTWLSPGGRLVINWMLLIDNIECPSSYIISTPDGQAKLVDGSIAKCGLARKYIKVAPDHLWNECLKQAKEAAGRCGFKLVASRNLYHKKQEGLGVFEDKSAEMVRSIRMRLGVSQKKKIPNSVLAEELRKELGSIQESIRAEGGITEHKNLCIMAILEAA
ncbi:hypothetical protein FQN57_003541 [Myotisia sp. PD_48]|nr:hypothetical protein FQN57_003541 [Myotisia sp. PD_48]